MKTRDAVFVHADDWIGMYVDGRLVMEGHSLQPFDVAKALGATVSSRGIDQDWLEENGFPKMLDGLPS